MGHCLTRVYDLSGSLVKFFRPVHARLPQCQVRVGISSQSRNFIIIGPLLLTKRIHSIPFVRNRRCQWWQHQLEYDFKARIRVWFQGQDHHLKLHVQSRNRVFQDSAPTKDCWSHEHQTYISTMTVISFIQRENESTLGNKNDLLACCSDTAKHVVVSSSLVAKWHHKHTTHKDLSWSSPTLYIMFAS